MASTMTLNARAPAFVRDHLASAGLEELPSIDFWDDDVWRFFVITDAGLYIGVFTPPSAARGPAVFDAVGAPVRARAEFAPRPPGYASAAHEIVRRARGGDIVCPSPTSRTSP
jgi:hypothetical protein